MHVLYCSYLHIVIDTHWIQTALRSRNACVNLYMNSYELCTVPNFQSYEEEKKKK